jgi:membrane-associated phospholipid phosphatase
MIRPAATHSPAAPAGPAPAGPAPAQAAPPQQDGADKRSPRYVLADPRVRLGIGLAATLVTGMAARRNHLGRSETTAFRVINDLPDRLYLPAWSIMQLGTLGAAPAAAGISWLAGDRRLAGRLLTGGTATWALSKIVKQMVHRTRPASLLPGARCRGRQAAGLGYLSGHAGVATALAAAAFPHLGTGGRAAALGTVPVVGLARVYVGAHLPLDVVGGAALGLAVDAILALATDPLTRRLGNASPGTPQPDRASRRRGRALHAQKPAQRPVGAGPKTTIRSGRPDQFATRFRLFAERCDQEG